MWGLDGVLNLGLGSGNGRTWKDFRFVILEWFGKDCGDFDRILNGLRILNRFGGALMFWKDLKRLVKSLWFGRAREFAGLWKRVFG